MGWFDWLRPARKQWYYLAVIDPSYGRTNYGPRYLTDDQATSWQLDYLEAYWGSDVRRYRWTGAYWTRA
jgi:hypothetical protein